eukprot:4817228-Pyramimonas_sp.AAC.1
MSVTLLHLSPAVSLLVVGGGFCVAAADAGALAHARASDTQPGGSTPGEAASKETTLNAFSRACKGGG